LIAQARLGYTEQQIKRELYQFDFGVGYASGGERYIYYQNASFMMVYYFDYYGICNLCALIPNNTRFLNTLVETYNRECAVISSKKWKYYEIDGDVITIDLNTFQGRTAFIYTSGNY
jgi:hypothetical protein